MKEIEKLKIAIQIMQVNNCDLINIDSVQMAVEGWRSFKIANLVNL